MDELERIFLLELAQQKAKREEPEAFAELIMLRQEMQFFFEEKPDADMEVLENGPSIGFDAVEGEVDIKQWVDLSGVDHIEFHCESVDHAVQIFGKRISDVRQALSFSRGFRLADFSHVNSMIELADWWYYITDDDMRKKFKWEGSIGTISEPLKDDECMNRKVINTAPICPARVPIRLGGPAPFTIIDTQQTDVVIGDCPVQDSLIIVLDRNAPMPPLNALRFQLARRMNSIKLEKDWADLVEGRAPTKRPREDMEFSWLLAPTKDLLLATGPKAIETMLRGLSCLANRAICTSHHDAIVKTVKDLEGVGPEVTYEMIQYAYDLARERCDGYNPKMLCWLSEE
ncbi:hypothetical protein [Pseudomonas putida]|uniref:hypothetical protein n=1 Tax=Pseudomonas putida TaxID=303 RepID=UPI0018AC045E|nr:hypothetical protein [Pseudomonas putida]MBF8657678.1 hypothetical protein [Pseudomonas putida]